MFTMCSLLLLLRFTFLRLALSFLRWGRLSFHNFIARSFPAETFDERLDELERKLLVLNVGRVQAETNGDGIKRMEHDATALLCLIL